MRPLALTRGARRPRPRPGPTCGTTQLFQWASCLRAVVETRGRFPAGSRARQPRPLGAAERIASADSDHFAATLNAALSALERAWAWPSVLA